jgi:hypothetical protein
MLREDARPRPQHVIDPRLMFSAVTPSGPQLLRTKAAARRARELIGSCTVTSRANSKPATCVFSAMNQRVPTAGR